MNTNAQIFLDYRTTARTHLTRVAGIDLHRTASSLCSFVRCQLHQLIPCGICDGLGETVILEHPAYIQVFKYDNCKSVDQLAALLMGKVAALICYALVNVRDDLAPLVAL